MVVLWKWIVAFPPIFGVWSDTSEAAFHIDTSNDYRIAETDRDIGDTLSSMIGITNITIITVIYTNSHFQSIGLRSVLLQLLPVTTILSLYVQVSVAFKWICST